MYEVSRPSFIVSGRVFRAGGGVGGRIFVSTSSLEGERGPSDLTSGIDAGGDVARSQAKVLANRDGETSCLVTGLNVLGGVIGRNLGLAAVVRIVPVGKSSFLTGSVSLLVFSNMDIRAFVGAIDAVSARSRLVTELAALCPPPLPLRLNLGVGCWAYGCACGG